MKKKLKIAIFTDTFLPQRDGVVTATLSLVKGLADKGHKLYIIAPKHKNTKEFSYKNIKVKRLSGIPALFYPGFKFTNIISPALIRYLKKEKIDIVHFQTPFTIGIQAILISRILKKPLIGTFHTFITNEEYLKHLRISPKVLKKFSWFYVRKYYNQCDLITCPTESAKQELLANGFTKPVKAISNGIDLFSFDSSKYKNLIKKYNLNNNTLLFIGRIAHEKNILFLLESFNLIVKKIPDAKLIIIGSGPQMNEVKEKIKELNLYKNIILTGRIEHEDLLKSGFFKASNIFVTASTTETQGITTLEAQANALPCVGINARGIKDIITDNYNGYLVKEGDKKEFSEKIISLLKNKTLREKMSKNALKEIKKHDMKKVISIWEKTYSDVLKDYNAI